MAGKSSTRKARTAWSGGKRIRLSVGKDAADAGARRQCEESELNALDNGVIVVPETGDSRHRSLAAAVSGYLEETKLTKKPKTLAAYTTTLNHFTESFPKLNVIRGLVKKNDWPRYTEEEPGMYEPEELATLFKACDVEERLWYEFFLMTGMREQEVHLDSTTGWPESVASSQSILGHLSLRSK
jgi:hypothetical protein